MFANNHDGKKTLGKTRRNLRNNNITLSFKEIVCENVRGCGSAVTDDRNVKWHTV